MLVRRQDLWFVLLSAIVVIAAFPVRIQAQKSTESPIVKNPAPSDYAKIKDAPDCLTAAVEYGDPSKGSSTMVLKATPGCAVLWHWHTPAEQLMMVSGIGRVQMKDEKPVLLRPGGFGFAPSHDVHRFSCAGPAPCMAYLFSNGPFDLHYVDDSGNEIAPEEALKAKAEPRGAAGVPASSAQARDSQRLADLQKIYAALKAFYKDNGFLPTTGSYGEENPGGWDYSSQGDFLPFLRSTGYLSRIPKDPINNGTGDVFYGGSGYSYAYYCYADENSLALGAKLESGKIYWIASHEKGYTCK
jgi:quercetin dioxygenase-like cupin family protein